MASYNRHIVIKDVEGFKANGAVMSTVAKFTGRDQYSTMRVLRGELFEHHAVNDLNFDYRLVHDHSVFICVKEKDLVPLSKEQFLLLDAISKPSDRFTAFTNGALELGLALKRDSIVFVDMYGPGHVKNGQVKGTIMYKGKVNGLPGIVFGIKLFEKGTGNNDGICHGRRYFSCKKGHGIFVPLNRLSTHAVAGSKKGQALSSSAVDVEDTPCGNTRSKSAVKDSSVDYPSVFKIGERVQFHDIHGKKKTGTVKWATKSTPTKTCDYTLVGIHTDDVAYASDFVNSVVGLSHHIRAPRDHCLALPESLVDTIKDDMEHSIATMIAGEQNKPKNNVLLEQQKVLKEAAVAKKIREDKELAEAVRNMGEDMTEQKRQFQQIESDRKEQLRSYEWQDSAKHELERAHENQHRNSIQTSASGRNSHDSNGKYSQYSYEKQQSHHGYPTQKKPSIMASSGDGPSYNLHVNSIVQIPCTDNVDVPYRYGVIKWIGNMPKMTEQVAGIELDEYLEGCGDGSWTDADGNIHQFFKCPHGKGLFYPVHSLQPDSKFSSQQSGYTNPLADVPQSLPGNRTVPVNTDLSLYIGERKGIQGHQNSCYLDSTIFGLFALSGEFDEIFLRDKNSPVGKILWLNIVNPLRAFGVVRYESVMELRHQLEKLGRMSGITSDEKDPEEFLNLLFKHSLKVNPFISIRRPFGIETEYFVQLFLEVSESPEPAKLGSLLNKMFKEQNISFTKIPSKLLIQVPRYGKRFQSFQKVIPDIQLDIAEVTDSVYTGNCFLCEERKATLICDDCYKQFTPRTVMAYCNECYIISHKDSRSNHTSRPCEAGDSKLDLLSVLCIETSHYVCFSRQERRWLFFDSMSNRVYDRYNIPKVEDCSKLLNEWVYPMDNNISKLKSSKSRDLPECIRRFTEDIYLCVYVHKDYGLY